MAPQLSPGLAQTLESVIRYDEENSAQQGYKMRSIIEVTLKSGQITGELHILSTEDWVNGEPELVAHIFKLNASGNLPFVPLRDGEMWVIPVREIKSLEVHPWLDPAWHWVVSRNVSIGQAVMKR